MGQLSAIAPGLGAAHCKPGDRIGIFTLIEGVADHICETLFLQDARVLRVKVKIVKLAISENGEEIGITLKRERPHGALV